jgi:hypothetical protein
MTLYTEVALGSPSNRGKIIPVNEITKYIELANNKNHQELYVSYYRFDEEIIEHKKKYNTLKGFDGKAYINQIVLDIDKGDSSDEDVLNKTKEFVNDMCYGMDIPESNVIPWFSGSGYHITLPNVYQFESGIDLPRVVKNTLLKHFPLADNIYDKTRLIRCGYTINNKTNLIKTPLTMDELFNYSFKEIHQIASKKGSLKEMLRKVNIVHPKINSRILQPIINNINSTKRVVSRSTELSDEMITPNQIAPCVQQMYRNGPNSGNRRNTLLRIISYYRRNGIPFSAAIAMAKDWSKMSDGFDESEAVEVTKYIYYNDRKYTCIDELMDANCKNSCIYFSSKKRGNDPLIPVYSSDQMHEMYAKMIEERKTNPGINLNQILDVGQEYWVRPRELAVVLADTGMGKTAFIQNFVCRIPSKTMYISPEFSYDLLWRRFRQIAESRTSADIDESYKNDALSYGKILKNIKVTDYAPSVMGLKRIASEEMPQVLVVDTLDCVTTEHYSGDQKSKLDTTIAALREIAQRQNLIVIAISHIPKSESDRIRQTNGKLHKHSGMGSAAIGQKADHVWSLDGLETSNIRHFYSTKSRDNQPFDTTITFDFTTFNFTQVTKQAASLQY